MSQPTSAVQRLGMVPAAPTAHSGHRVATSALKNHPSLGTGARVGLEGFPAHPGTCSSQTGLVVASALRLGDRNARAMLQFRAVMFLSLSLLC